jgi:hypothetical protein
VVVEEEDDVAGWETAAASPRLAAPYKSWLRRRGTQAPVGPLAAAVYGLPTWINIAWADYSLRAGLPKPLSPWVPIHVGLEVRAQLIHALKGSD